MTATWVGNEVQLAFMEGEPIWDGDLRLTVRFSQYAEYAESQYSLTRQQANAMKMESHRCSVSAPQAVIVSTSSESTTLIGDAAYVRNEEGVDVDLERYVENEVRATLSKLQSIVRDGGLRCDEMKKEIDGFQEKLESIIGERQVSRFRSSPSEPPPVSIARNKATALYLERSRQMLNAYKKCVELQTQRSSKHPTEEGNAR